MSQSSGGLMEMILNECRAAKGEPWYPSDYVSQTGVDREQLNASLDELRLGGLIELTPWMMGKGQGYALTETGADVVNTPRLMNQIRHNGSIKKAPPVQQTPAKPRNTATPDWDRSSQIRDILMTPSRPNVTLTLVFVNVLIFLFGMMLANQANISLNSYLGMGQDAALHEIRMQTGMLQGRQSLMQGEWWRLITSCFVHIGGLHILLNMWILLYFGGQVERILGGWRYLIVYFASGIGGSLAAVIYTPDYSVAGASGAICGLLGGFLVWVWINKRYLPNAQMVLRNLLINVVLITAISFLPRVSGAGHLGGGITGLVFTVPINYTRFGTQSQKWLGWTGVAALFLILGALVYAAGQPQSELEHARAHYLPKYVNAVRTVTEVKFLNPFIDTLNNEEKVSVSERDKVFRKLDQVIAELETVSNELSKRPEYRDKRINAALQTANDRVDKWIDYFSGVKKAVDKSGNPIHAQIKRVNSIQQQVIDLGEQFNESILSISK